MYKNKCMHDAKLQLTLRFGRSHLLLLHSAGNRLSIYSAKPRETQISQNRRAGRMMSGDEVSHVSQSLLCSFTVKKLTNSTPLDAFTGFFSLLHVE